MQEQVQIKKMNVLKKLSNAEVSKPYNGLPALSIGYHKIEQFRESVGKYGMSIIAELKTEVIFLPKYMEVKLKEKDIEDLLKKNYSYFSVDGINKIILGSCELLVVHK